MYTYMYIRLYIDNVSTDNKQDIKLLLICLNGYRYRSVTSDNVRAI